jgi:AraC-like DNA-binding protein/mannose-6-phosphate isomerase-like protein (cupin superfamily)
VLDDLTPFRTTLASDSRYLLLWCHTGTVAVRCGTVERLTAGQCVLIPPGKDATLAVAPGAVIVPVRIAVEEVAEGMAGPVGPVGPVGPGRSDAPQVFTPGEEWNDWLLHHFTASIAPIREPGYRAAEIVERLRGSAGAVAAQPMPTMLTMPRSPEARQVARALVKDPACGWTVAQWASSAQVGERTLHRAFVAETGLTIAAWRREVRLDAALSLLRDPEKSVAQVAEAVGFRTSTGFIRAFSTRSGLTPTAWRNGQDAADAPGVLPSEPPVWAAASAPPSLDHGFHLLLWVYRGTMRLTVGEQVIDVTEGEVAWMPAYRGHGVQLGPGSVVLPLTFTVAEVEIGEKVGPVTVPAYEVPALLQHVMANQCGVGPTGYDRTVVPGRAWVPGQVVAADVSGSWTSVGAATVADALLADLRDRRTPAQWAASVGLTVRALNERFREATGMTLLQWRTTVRLQAAMRMLSTGATPSTAAHAVGYLHLSQFSRDFAARYGMGPREFRGKVSRRVGTAGGHRLRGGGRRQYRTPGV